MTLLLLLSAVCLVQSSALLSNVEQYEVVRPQRILGRHKRSLKKNQVREQPSSPEPHTLRLSSLSYFAPYYSLRVLKVTQLNNLIFNSIQIKWHVCFWYVCYLFTHFLLNYHSHTFSILILLWKNHDIMFNISKLNISFSN